MPSKTNISTRWPRWAPTARAMPISDLRSEASMTKIKKISTNPAVMPNRPATIKMVVKALAASSLSSSVSRLTSSTPEVGLIAEQLCQPVAQRLAAPIDIGQNGLEAAGQVGVGQQAARLRRELPGLQAVCQGQQIGLGVALLVARRPPAAPGLRRDRRVRKA